MELYCVKCRSKQIANDAEIVVMKNGKQAVKGKCPVCTTGMYRIGALQCQGTKVEGLDEINRMLKEGMSWEDIEYALDTRTMLRNVLQSKL